MANLFQAWDNEAKTLGAAKATPEQIEARRQEVAKYVQAKAKEAGLSSKQTNNILSEFDTYSRRNSASTDDQMTPEERDMVKRQKEGTVGTGALLEVGRAIYDAGKGIASSVPRVAADVSQAWSDVGDNDPTELSARIARKAYDASYDMQSGYSEGSKRAKEDFWTPRGMAMGVAENLGQIAVTAAGFALTGGAAAAAGLSKAAQLGTAAATGATLAYGQGYGQGKENALDEINKTSNKDLYANVVAEHAAWKEAGSKGEQPYLVKVYQESEGDLNKMKDLMAEHAGDYSGAFTAITSPLAMGVGSMMTKKLAQEAAKEGSRSLIAQNILRQTSAADIAELSRRIAVNSGVAPQLAKVMGKQAAFQGAEEFLQEGGEGYFANKVGSQARGDKGNLNQQDWDSVLNQGAQGAAIGAIMGGGGSLLLARNHKDVEAAPTAPLNTDALVSAINNAVGPIVQTRDTLKTQVDDLANQVKAFDEASANGQLNAADIARKQALLQELAAKQTELSAVETQAQDAAIIASNDALKQYAQAGEVPDFNAMGDRLGINPDDLLSLYDQHSTSIKQQQAATDTRNKVASLIEANDTEGAQAFLEQNGFKQDQADVIMGDAMKSIAAKNKEANAKKAAEAKQQAKLDAATKLRAERDSELATILKTKPDASFANDVLPILQKKYKLQSGSEALSVWNEAKKQSKAAPVEQQADAAEVTDEERLNAKKALYSLYKNKGHPDDVVASHVMGEQERANKDGAPRNIWESVSGAIGSSPASQKSPFKDGKLITTIHPEGKATADEQTPAIDNTQAIADELAQHVETKTRPDFIGLGKKYNAKPLDLDKQYREMLRVKKEQSKTAPPVAPVPNEAAPIVQPPPKQKAADRPIDPEKDSLLVALAKIGGLSRDEAISHGVDKAMLGHRPIFGKLLFRTDGKSFDSAAEALAQDNYPVFEDDQYNDAGLHGGNGRSHTGKALLLALTDALNGNDIGTPQYYVAKAQKAFEEEQEQARIDALFDGKGNSKADWLDDVSDAIVDELIENPSTATQEAIEVIQNDAGTEAQDVTGNSQTETQPTADETSPPVSSQEATSQSESGGREGAGSGQANPINVGSATIGTGSQDYANKLLAPAKKALDTGNYSEHTTKTGQKIRLVIAEDNKSEAVIFAFDEKGNRPVATMTYSKYEENGTRFNPTIEVDKYLRRQGIATAMYKLAEQNGGLIPDINQKGQARSDDGQKFRESMVKKTNGQQIAEALDATATAIGAAAHQSAINRFKKEGGLTYAKPEAIAQVQKDDRYNVEINTDGHAVVKGIKDGDAWVGVAPGTQTERKEAQEIGDAEFDARMKELGYQEQEEIIDHVTAKGKTIRGVVRKGITKEEAKLIDPYSFAKDGGFFLREKYLTKAEPPKEEKKQEQLQGKVIAKKGIVISNDVGSDGWRVISDVKDTDTMIKVIQNEDMLSERILTMNMDMFKERLEQDTKRRSQYADQQELKQPEQAQDKPIKKDNGPYYADGYSAFNKGQPRTLPSYFPSATGTNPKNWLKGWDAAKAEQAKNNTPTPVKQPETRDLPNQDRLVGKNSEGQDLYEDSRGVRFFKQSGAKVYEGIAIGRNNSLGAIQREDEYRTVEEVAARQPKPQPKEEKPAPKQPSANTIFTEDAAAAARERLKKKLGGNRLNSGFDPEILQDGLILAGYHIEKGARTFAAFAKAIVEDMGDVVKPYIKSWYMGVKYDPRAANFDGMSSAAEVDSADIEAILKVSSQQPATPAPTAKGEIVDDYDENDLDASDGTEGWKYGGYIFGDDDVSYGVGYREIRKVKNNGTQVTIRQIRIYDENRASYMAVWEHESSKITDGILDGFSIDTAKFHFSMSDATENAFSNDATDGDALWTRFGREITDSIKYEMSREPKPNKAPKDKIGLPSPKQPTDKGDSNESQGNGSNSTRPLENVLPEGNQPTGKEGNTTTGGRGIGGANTTRNGRSNAGRSNRSGGVAAGQDSMDFEQPTQLDEQELAEEAEKVEDKTLPGQPRTPKKLTGVNPGNYRITEADKIGTGTPGERLKQNLEAIRLVRKLQEEGRYATKEEQAVLAKYVGWGGLANAFDEASKQKQYREANAELKRLLSPEEYTEALLSTRNAHFTSPKVIKAMYDLVRHLGFMGGNVLEPTVGSGNFIGLMPEDFSASSNWYAAEIDPITGALAQYLYPEGQVMAGTGFQDAEFAYGKFDLAIGNPPFGDTRITDTNKARKHLTRMKIHNYIISKSGMHLRPGGVMAMVITHRFLDAKDDEARAELAKNFRFVGALRLPNTAFKENANTEVTTDIVIFQRLKPGEEATTNLEWLNNSVTIKGEKGEDISINGYFAKHPEMMLGKPTLDGTMYAGARGDEFTLEAIPGMDLEQAIADRIKTNLADQAGTMDNSAEYLEAASAGNMVNRADVGIGGFLFEGGKLSMRESDDANGNPVFVVLTPSTQWTEKTELGQKRYDRIIGMLHLRQQTIEMIALEMADAPIKLLDKHRALLNKSYDAFVKEHGFLADPANSKLMDGDIGLEFGLENSYQKALSVARAKATGMKPKPASAKKADILSRRVFTPHKVVTSADSARDGYLISLSEHGKLDIPYISELTGKTIKQVTDELSSDENPLIFMNPKTEKWEQHDEYLSGNVKVKHQEAVRAGLETNAKALEAVFPEDVKPNDLHITVRSGWLPTDHFVQFLDLLGVKNSKVSINAFTGTMFVTRGDETANALSEEFKNEDYDISEMLTNLANGRVLTAYDREPDGNGGYKRVVNKDRTAILSIQSKKMKELFNDWMRLDDGRMQEAAKAFNEKMNTHSTREYNGAKMLVTVGASPSIKLLNTQKNAAWRMIQSPVILLDHVVGAGKTFTLITGIMERRRLGLSRKPAMVVPNHLVGQWAKDFYALYPAAKLLAISEKDFAKSNRQRLFARMATGNFDCIIMGHSSLKFIQVSAATESKMINEEIAYLEKALAVASDSEDKRTVKSLANQISKKKERFKALADIKRDTLVEWEQMGIDYLGVDESHEFKNLEYSTSMQRVTGMNDPKGSQRAFDLYMKIRELRARGGGVAFATGTPISNSLVEMYTVLRYLNREELKSRGNDVFDAWVGTYGEVDSRIEYTATQKLKSRNVLARFGNLPELLQLYNEVADTVTMTNLKEIYAEQVRESNKLTGENKSEKMPIPPVKDGGRQLDVGNLTAAQSEYMDYLVARAESIEEQGGKNDPKIDNLLWISNDARKMSLDMRLVDPMAQDSPDSKVNRAANNIKRIYDRTNANKGTQLVFCDLSTPKKGADKEGKKIIKAALEKLGLDNDSRFARMMEDETLQIQWRMIMDRADNIIEDENTDDATRERIEDWLDKLDSDIEGILLTADSGFSVYDALKQTLVDKGIPENEIAFIHDYNSRDQKTELFGLVNDGSIRVLLGSSPKMGAGTNVQKRLVALHHMDAPWRPSDVEQREGRIIRQGNLFATPPSAENPNPLYDPNFEVEIKAYSTNRTFDTVMWQTLQRKAAMIEQFRSGEREMVEPNGDAAGYAEFMAQSTGNPAFKRKIEIEGELNGLQAQKRSYMARQGEASRFLEHYDQAKARALKSLEGHKDGSINSATYNGKTYANDYEAARLAEEAIYREEFDQWEIDDKEHGPLLLDYIKLSEEQKATAKKPKTPKKPAYPTIASKRMQAKSEWSQMVAKMMEEAEKNGEAKAKIYGDKELKLYREESNGEKTEWYLELGNVDIAYSISKTPNVGTIETGFMPNVMVNNLFRHRKNAENRIAELEESKPIAERVLAKPFPDQEKLESMEKEYEVVKDEVDSLAWSESKRRSLQVNRYIAGDKERQLTVKGGIDLVKHGNWRVIEKTINTKGKESVTTWVVVNKGDGAYKGQPTNNFATKQEATAWAEKEQLENDPEGKPSPTRSTVNKTERMPPVKYEVTENGNAYEVRQPASPSSRMSQINLFSSPLPSPTVDDNQRQAAGNFAINIESVEQGRIKSVPGKVTDSKGAASILREFGNRAQETLLILMLDENNKPIEVARHSIGNATSSIVDVGIAVGSIASNPNARTVYFGHNHPSGNAEPSQADKNITEKLKEFTDLIGVNFGGHVVIGENDYSLIKHKFDVTENIDYQPATNSRNSVPVTERIITARSKDKPMEASSPQAAESIVEKIDQDGLILLNSQNKVMGFIAITPQEMANLKGNPALVRKMFSDWSKAGADSTIIVTTSAQNEAADNISNALMSTGTMRVLDHFYKNSSGKYLSRRNLATFRPQEGPYFSRRSNINDPDDWSATPRIQVAKELERLIAQSKDGAIDTEAVESLLDRVKAKQDDKNHNEAMKPRVRGYDWIVERLTRAKRLGELPTDMVDMTLWFLAKNPDIANDLGLKLSKEKANQQYDGQYITGSRIMELVKQDTNSPLGAMLQQLSSQDTRNEVGVHELLHHTERMLPQNIRDGITKEWANAIIAERKKAAKEIDAAEYARLKNLDDVSPDKETFEATLKDTTWPKAAYYRLRAIDAIIEANAGSTQKLEAMFKDGTFDTKNYHMVNASEFWAVKGASIIAAKYRAKGFVRPVVQWLKGLYQQLRNIFGLSSDVPVMRGLNAVIKGDGQFVTTQMLSSNKGTLQSISDSNGQPNPSPSPTNPKLDRLLHGIAPGEKLFNALAQPIHKWLDTHSSSQWKLVNNMSPAFKQMMREYLRDQKASEEQTKNIVENGIAMSADERILLSDVLEKMVASGTTIPQHIVQVAAAMRSALSGQTDELVRLGMLSEGSAERWRDTYLPRLYDKVAKDPINRALAKRLNVVGDHLKGRGIFREVEESLQAKYERLGWENRAKGKKGHVIMWRDYTPEERIKMGEIRDALHRFATGFLSTQRDIATGRLLEKIADNTDLASATPVAGWTLVPTATIKETGGVKRYGKLSGMYVHPDVWENTKHYIDDRDGLMEFYRQTLSVWKQGKTALNVVAHMNNVVSNAVMVTAAGANMADVARGYDSIMKEDQYYKEAKELGMFASGHFTGDIRDYFGGEIQDATTPSNFVFKAFKAAWRNKGFEFMRKMYDAEDQLFRMSLYRKARELGATQAESIDYAETFMFNYADLPAGIKKIRDFGLPFISYTYKAVPAVTRLAFTQPHRVLALVGMVYAFNAIAYAMLGADADEDKERKNLPDYMQGYSAWGVPKLVRLPWNDGEKAAFLDVYRWAPLGDFFAIGNRTGGADIPTWAMMSGPYWSFYNTMIQNRNGLTGKNYLEDTDTDRQVFFKRMKFGLSEWVPMYYHLDKNLNAVRNELGDTPASKLLEGMGYTGTDMRGDPSELKNSLLGATGIKVRKLDMDDQQQRKLVALKSEMLDRVRQMRRIQRDKSNPYRERDIAAQKEEIKRLKEKAQEIRKQ